MANRIINVLFSLAVIISPLIFFTDLTQNPYRIQETILKSILLLIWAVWMLKSLKEKKIVFFKTVLDFPLFAFLLISIASLVVSFICHQNMRTAIYEWGIKNILFLIINILLVFYGAVYFLRDEKSIKRVFHIIFLVSFVISAYGILQYFGIELIWSKSMNPFGGRCISTFGNPNFLSSFFVVILPVIFGFFIGAQSIVKKILLFVLFLSGFTVLLFTFCRSSWVGFVCSMILMLMFWAMIDKKIILKNKKELILSFICIVLVVSFLPRNKIVPDNPTVVERAIDAVDIGVNNQAIYQRLLIWTTGLSILKDYPFLGCGWGCFDLFYPFYQGRLLDVEFFKMFRTHANNAHNEIVEILAQTGIIGFIIFCWLFFNLTKYCYHIIKIPVCSKKNEFLKILIPCLIGSIAGMFIDNMLNVSFHFPIPAFFFWLNVGILMNIGAQIEKNNKYSVIDLENIKNKFFWKKVIYIAGMLILVIMGKIIYKDIKDFRAAVYFFKAYKLSQKNNFQEAVEEYKKADKLNAFDVHTNYQMGNALSRLGNVEKAIKYYNNAVISHPGYDEIYFNLGVIYSKTGEWDKAIDVYRTALKINPLNVNSYINMGHIYIGKEMIQESLQCYSKAIEIDPRNKDAYNNLGYIYIKMEKWEKAEECYLKALQIDPYFDVASENLSGLRKMVKMEKIKETKDESTVMPK